MDNGVTIRAMEVGDAAAVAELSGQLGYPRQEQDVLAWLQQAASGRLCGLVAVADGEVCGWVEIGIDHWLHEEAYAEIGGLVVSEEMRGKQVGQQLCTAAEQWAREQGMKLLRVRSRVTRTEAHRFYLREGYERVKTTEVFEKHLG